MFVTALRGTKVKNKHRGFHASTIDRYCFTVVAPLVHATPLTIASVPITKIRTGWGADAFAIETGQPISNPASCAVPDGYASGSNEPGYKTYYATTLTAFAMKKPVTIIVSDTECSSFRPKIMGIYVAP